MSRTTSIIASRVLKSNRKKHSCVWFNYCFNNLLLFIFLSQSFGRNPLGDILWEKSFGRNPLGEILWEKSFGRNPLGEILWEKSFGTFGRILWDLWENPLGPLGESFGTFGRILWETKILWENPLGPLGESFGRPKSFGRILWDLWETKIL